MDPLLQRTRSQSLAVNFDETTVNPLHVQVAFCPPIVSGTSNRADTVFKNHSYWGSARKSQLKKLQLTLHCRGPVAGAGAGELKRAFNLQLQLIRMRWQELRTLGGPRKRPCLAGPSAARRSLRHPGREPRCGRFAVQLQLHRTRWQELRTLGAAAPMSLRNPGREPSLETFVESKEAFSFSSFECTGRSSELW